MIKIDNPKPDSLENGMMADLRAGNLMTRRIVRGLSNQATRTLIDSLQSEQDRKLIMGVRSGR